MALSGLDIYKLLPKTNCKECGSSSCMAFAMRVAAKKANLEECKYASEEARKSMTDEVSSGVRQIEFGPSERRVKAGGEKVLFRHEETFYNKTVFAVEIDCVEKADNIKNKLAEIFSIKFNILRKEETIDAVTVNAVNCAVEKFTEVINLIKTYGSMPLIIKLNSADVLNYIAVNLAQDKPLLYPESLDDAVINILKDKNLPVIVSALNADELKSKVQALAAKGIENIVLHIKTDKPSEKFSSLDALRKEAIKNKTKEFSFPVFAEADGENYSLSAAFFICKYASIINFKKAEKEVLFPLFVLRNNIYQDPRKPIQVEAKLYEIGAVNETSPVAVTTNFSLTYFAVSSEIEGSRIPAYLLVVDTGGTSVLSAWASDKINAGKINSAIKDTGLEDKVKHRNLIIPGYIYPVQEDLQEVSGWKVLVGPKESKDLGNYLKGLGAKS